jgi:hypothetical protein
VQASGQSVTGTAGDYGHGGVAMEKPPSHFVEGAVAARCRHNVVVAYSRCRQFGGMSGTFREDDFILDVPAAQNGSRFLPEPPLVAVPGNGVDDEEYPFFGHNPLIDFECGKNTEKLYIFARFFLRFKVESLEFKV